MVHYQSFPIGCLLTSLRWWHKEHSLVMGVGTAWLGPHHLQLMPYTQTSLCTLTLEQRNWVTEGTSCTALLCTAVHAGQRECTAGDGMSGEDIIEGICVCRAGCQWAMVFTTSSEKDQLIYQASSHSDLAEEPRSLYRELPVFCSLPLWKEVYINFAGYISLKCKHPWNATTQWLAT